MIKKNVKLVIASLSILSSGIFISQSFSLLTKGTSNVSFTITAGQSISYRLIYDGNTVTMSNSNGVLTPDSSISSVSLDENDSFVVQSSSDGGTNWTTTDTYNIPIEGTFTFTSYNISSSSFSITTNTKAVYLVDLGANSSSCLKAWNNYYVAPNHEMNVASSRTALVWDSSRSAFKALIDGSITSLSFGTLVWGSSWGDGNYDVISTPSLTYSTSTPLFNLSSFNKAVQSDFTSLNSPLSTYRSYSSSDFNYYLIGSFDSWTASDTKFGFETNFNGNTSYLRIHNQSGSNIEFKSISKDGTWYGGSDNWNISNNQTALIEFKPSETTMTWHNV
mgnify:CR=1 FL=1